MDYFVAGFIHKLRHNHSFGYELNSLTQEDGDSFQFGNGSV